MIQITINLRAVLIGVVLLLVAAGIATPFAISMAEDGPTADRVSEQRISAPLGTAFGYQGLLSAGGSPANGPYDFKFTLFDGEVVGAVIAGAIFIGNVPVTNGLFSATLDFGSVFNGQSRWLAVEAKAQSSGSYEQLFPRQQFTPVPYAMYAANIPLSGNGTSASAAHSDHDHFGQDWSGTAANGLMLTNSMKSGSALRGVAPNGVGVYASGGLDGIQAFSATGFGVSAVSVSGNAVYGHSTTNAAVVGESSSGVGVAGGSGSGGGVAGYSGTGDGVYGETRVVDRSGVYGRNFKNGIGILGISDDETGGNRGGAGVVGSSGGFEGPPAGTGVFGVAYGDSAHGVHGKVVGPGSWAGYFDGRVFASLGYSSPPSDIRLKTNVGSMASGLDAVQQLRPVSFNWKDGRDALAHDGLIAQEVQAILPDLVVMGPDGYYGLDYNGLTAVLVNAIQEQQAQIEALKQGNIDTASPSTVDSKVAAGTSPTAPQVTVIREATGSPLNGWALPGAIALFALGLFAVAGAMLRRPRAGRH